MQTEKTKKKINFFAIGTCCVLLLFLVKLFFVDIWKVSGNSMFPTFDDGDFVLLSKCSSTIERFDVVVCKRPDMRLRKVIKRVIGLPNESVSIRDGVIYINNEKLDDFVEGKTDSFEMADREVVLGDDEYFVLGDNREGSIDSRYFGAVKKKSIVGIVTE